MMESIQQLQQLGFSQYEAQAYVALLRENPLNGYELAKASGIPRPNIYAVLRKLEEMGAVLRLSTPEGARYSPVPAGELLAKLKRRYQRSIEAASAGLQQIASPPQVEPVLNFRGYAELIDQARALVDRTGRHLLLSLWPEEAAALAEPLEQASERGVQITTLCLRACPQPCPACRGAVFRYDMAPGSASPGEAALANPARWLVIVSDEEELLAGEILSGGAVQPASEEGSTAAVRTRQQMLVRLTGGYIQNSIALATILSGLGQRLYSELDPQSIASLNELRPFHTRGAWLDELRERLHLENQDS
jgi:DNA-binding MarR family transcriptional regulator